MSIILVILLISCIAQMSLAEQQTLTGANVESSESTVQGYVEKVSEANQLRRQLHSQLNLLSHFSAYGTEKSANGKLMMHSLVGGIRKSFDDLDSLLDSFIPNIDDASEVVSSLKQLDNSDEEAKLNTKRSKLTTQKHYEWLKRNMNFYNKIPVIRNGK